MSILINKNSRVITQGITGKTGQFHTEKCQEYANGKECFVAGVNPKKAGESIFGKELTRNPEKYYTKEILDAIDIACQKIFMYGMDSGSDVIAGEEAEEEEVLNEIVEEKETKKKKK